MIYNHDKNTWDFNGHSGQNTYSICNNTLNNTEYSKYNKHIKYYIEYRNNAIQNI